MRTIEFYKCRYHYDHYVKEEGLLARWGEYPYCPHKGDYVCIDNVTYIVVFVTIKYECVEVLIEKSWRQ